MKYHIQFFNLFDECIQTMTVFGERALESFVMLWWTQEYQNFNSFEIIDEFESLIMDGDHHEVQSHKPMGIDYAEE